MDKDTQITELIEIALWSIRRLPTKNLKQYALNDLRKVVPLDHKYSDFIDKEIREIFQ